MPYTSGIATSPIDLYRKFRAFVLDKEDGAGWDLTFGEGEAVGDVEGVEEVRSNGSSYYNLINARSANYMSLATNTYVDFKFFIEQDIGSISLSMPDLNAGLPLTTIASSPLHFLVQASSDGLSWSNVGEWANQAAWNDTETRTFTLPSPITTRWLRITFPTSRSGGITYCGEVQFFKPGGTRLFVNIGDGAARFQAKSPYTASGISASVSFRLVLRESANICAIGLGAYQNGVILTDESGCPYLSTTLGSSGTYAALWFTDMPYWFYGNDRYIYAFVKVGSTYRQLGCGYILPYSTPEQWPMPFFVGGEINDYNSAKWDNDTNYSIRGFSSPGVGAFYMFEPQTNTWVEVRDFELYSNYERAALGEFRLWPLSFGDEITALSRNMDESLSLIPLIPVRVNHSVYGELQNIYYCPGGGITSEDTVSIGGATYRIFQNAWRTSNFDYCAVREV